MGVLTEELNPKNSGNEVSSACLYALGIAIQDRLVSCVSLPLLHHPHFGQGNGTTGCFNRDGLPFFAH